MKHLINREEYIKEYLRVCNQEMITDINNNGQVENELYEGLLGTLFGGLKMLMKKDWASIKCKNPSVLKHLQSIDKSLSGYTMMKMQFSSECNIIRQNIADYFNDVLNYKLDQVDKEDDANEFLKKENEEKEENKDAKGIEKSLNIKDKTILDSLKKYKTNIDVACKKSPKLREYADYMLNSVDIFVNDVVLAELEKKGADKAKLEEEKKKMEEERQKQEAERKKKDEESKKAEQEAMKKLAKDRDDAMRSLGVKPIGAMDGDKAIDAISKQYIDMLKEFNGMSLNESALPKGYGEVLRSDTYLGLKDSLEELDWNFSENDPNASEGFYDKFLVRVILNKINTVFGVVADNQSKKLFKEIPSASVQAMMISLANAVIYGFMGKKFNIENNDARISLISKCAIDSDATIGFNLPLIDPKKPENGNFFVSIMNQFKNADISSKEVEDAIKSMDKSELELIEKEWGGDKKEDKKDDKKGKKDEKKDEKGADPKDQSAFAKEFGPLVMKDFRQNMANLFDIVVTKAKQIKLEAEKAREADATKAQQESDAEAEK